MKALHRSLAALALGVLAVAGCETGEAAEEAGPRLLTATAFRGDLLIRAEATIFALGGVGGLFEVTTNPPQARGQGLGMAARDRTASRRRVGTTVGPSD